MAAKTTKRKNSTKKKMHAKESTAEHRTTGEILILILLAVCILLVLSNFGVGGTVGEAVSSVLFGVFGFYELFTAISVIRRHSFSYVQQGKYSRLHKGSGSRSALSCSDSAS